jgi:hypothetical protein
MSEQVRLPRTLTGHWAGYYIQRDRRRELTAHLTQAGDRLHGAMQDLQTQFEQSVFEMAVDGGLPPGADEKIVARLRRHFPELPADPVRAATALPPRSSLEGHVRGRTVYFLKTYQGEAFSGYRVGRHTVGVSLAGHVVHYKGVVSGDGRTIEGKWWMDAQPQLGVPRAEGFFVLTREN